MVQYFKKHELACPCCGECNMGADFIDMLVTARTFSDIPFTINSAYRCEKHNKDIGGVERSAHIAGKAVDIRVRNSHERFLIKYALYLAGFTRIGDGGNFIHVDSDEQKAQGVEWQYK